MLGDCGVLTVIANAGEAHRQGVKVYNLEVEQAHTYFVLAEHTAGTAMKSSAIAVSGLRCRALRLLGRPGAEDNGS